MKQIWSLLLALSVLLLSFGSGSPQDVKSSQTGSPASPPSNNKTGNNTKNKEGSSPTPVRPHTKDAAEMVFIPAGSFLMGDDDAMMLDVATLKRNNPRHTVRLSGYWIYKTPVTVAQFRKFTKEQKYPYDWEARKPAWGWQDKHPMVCVTYADAVAYGKWAFGDNNNHLPTEAQWERAARGTQGSLFPWGDTFDPDKLWSSKMRIADARSTTEVGKWGVSVASGCTDMAGSIWQWCQDWYDADFWSNPASDRLDPVNQSVGEQKQRVVRGGGWLLYRPVYFRSAWRFPSVPTAYLDVSTGFRCASGS